MVGFFSPIPSKAGDGPASLAPCGRPGPNPDAGVEGRQALPPSTKNQHSDCVVEIKLVAGAGSDHNLRPEQVKMVAGTSTYHNLPPGGRPVELGDVCEIAKQMVLAAVECAEPQLLFRSAA